MGASRADRAGPPPSAREAALRPPPRGRGRRVADGRPAGDDGCGNSKGASERCCRHGEMGGGWGARAGEAPIAGGDGGRPPARAAPPLLLQ